MVKRLAIIGVLLIVLSYVASILIGTLIFITAVLLAINYKRILQWFKSLHQKVYFYILLQKYLK